MLPCLNVCIGSFSLNQHSVDTPFSLSVYAASQRALTGVVESLCFTDVDGSVLELPHTHWIKWDSKTWQVFLILFLDAINKPLEFKIFKKFWTISDHALDSFCFVSYKIPSRSRVEAEAQRVISLLNAETTPANDGELPIMSKCLRLK